MIGCFIMSVSLVYDNISLLLLHFFLHLLWLIHSPVFLLLFLLFCLYTYVWVSHAVGDVVCMCLYRLAEMESQNCSFFTDSLSPDESLWVFFLPHTTNPLITTTTGIICVYTLCSWYIDCFCVYLCALHVCSAVRERLGNHLNNNHIMKMTHSEQRAHSSLSSCTCLLWLKSVAVGRYTSPCSGMRGVCVFVKVGWVAVQW